MNLQGIQKTTLLDYPGKVACTVFTGGCNLRCPFCHNAGVVESRYSGVLTEEEFFEYLKRRKGILDGVCVSGGEPTLQPELPEFLRQIKALGLAVKLDTNGFRPEILRRLLSEGLCDMVAMDIKNCKEKYALTCGVAKLDTAPAEESVRLLMESGLPYEFRTTVVRELHTEEDIAAIGEWIAGAERYWLQNFVDSGELIGKGYHAHSAEKLEKMRKIAEKFVKNAGIRGL